jgi:hypothetical protein
VAVWRVVVSGSLYSVESWANVYHIDPIGSFSHSDVMDAFEDAYANAASGGGMGFITPCPGTVATGLVGVHMSAISLQAVSSPGIPEVRGVSHNGGQNTAGGLPVDTCLVISWRTLRAGRSYRGRTYLPPFHENQNDDSGGTFPVPLLATVTALTVNANKLVDDLVAADAPLVVYSRKLAAAEAIQGGYIDTSWDTQRRRGAGVVSTRVLF